MPKMNNKITQHHTSHLPRRPSRTSNTNITRRIRTQIRRPPTRTRNRPVTKTNPTRPRLRTIQITHGRRLLRIRRAFKIQKPNPTQLRRGRRTSTLRGRPPITALNLRSIVAILDRDAVPGDVCDGRGAKRGAARVELYSDSFGAVDHGCARDVDVGDEVGVCFAERADAEAVAAGAGYAADGQVVAA